MGVADLLQIALGVLSIATLAGLGFTWGRVQGLERRATSAESEAAALRERVEDRDETIRDMTTAHAQEIADLRAEIAALGRVVTGEAHLVALANQLDMHHKSAETHWTNVEAILRAIRDETGAT